MQALSNSVRHNLSNAKALRRARELFKVSRNELAKRVGISNKTIEKYENGRIELDESRIKNILLALNITNDDFIKIKKGKGIGTIKKKKIVLTNSDRRSYKRIITKEVRILKVLRLRANLSQDQASGSVPETYFTFYTGDMVYT
ncbi:MAG: helix-turn-helix domain-containing protein, partial [Bacteriovoracaceae bacterium]